MPTLDEIRWSDDQGEWTLRVNYNLSTDSIVFDLGGYDGKWSQRIYDRYKCKIYIFEPVDDFYNIIKNLFINNNNIFVYNDGAGGKNEFVDIYMSENSTSVFDCKNNNDKKTISIKKLSEFIDEQKIKNIDLLKINIEGMEYDLLDDLIFSDKLSLFEDIQIQFHDFVPNATERRNSIRESLSKTHYLTYDYEFIWENWKRK